MQVLGLDGVTSIAAGPQVGFAVRSDGTVWAWGLNGFGQVIAATTDWDEPHTRADPRFRPRDSGGHR